MASKKKQICPNCKGTDFIAIYDGTKKVEGQTKCTNCAYVIQTK